MDIEISPCRKLHGKIRFPGDKSISHRLALLGAIAEGITEIDNFATSADCHNTLSCLQSLGVRVEKFPGNRIQLVGVGLHGLAPSQAMLDAGNSGSTIRMLSGILAGQSFTTTISGDLSLVQRPMKRVITPLLQMGAEIEARENNFPPLKIRGGKLNSIQYRLPVASAQVKSAILLAGLFAEGTTQVTEPVATRNHTELALTAFGIELGIEGTTIAIRSGQSLAAIQATVPGDISSAAFFLVAASLLPGSEVILENVGMNPGRRGIVDLLIGMGASIEILREGRMGEEPVADILVKSSPLQGGKISGDQIPGIIDEIPILAILGSQTEKGLEIRDAGELRVKESDRIRSVVENLHRLGGVVEEYPDGFKVEGQQKLHGSRISSFGDHRIAMSFAVAGLLAEGVTMIEEAECAAISFPDFYQTLQELAVV